jgi:hypothetical protein
MQESTRNGRKPSRLDEARTGCDISPRLEGQRMRHPGVSAVTVVLDEKQPPTVLEISAHQREHRGLVVDEVQRFRRPGDNGQLERSHVIAA